MTHHMTHHSRRQFAPLAAAAAAALLSACNPSDDGGADPSRVQGPAYEGEATPSESFDFPEVHETGDGYFIYAASDGDLPAAPSTRVLRSSEIYGVAESEQSAPRIAFGDEAVLRWEMFSWRSGEKVEDSDDLFGGHPVEVVMGGASGNGVVVPSHLHEAVIGQRVGDRLEVVFNHRMHDLPPQLSRDDAYVLVVDIVDKN